MIKISKLLTLSSLNNEYKLEENNVNLTTEQSTTNQLANQLIADQLIVQGELNKTKLLHLLKNTSQDKPLQLEIGVDEAGRGPLLGSVLVGAVILPPEYTGELGTANSSNANSINANSMNTSLEQTLDLSNTPLSKLNDSKKISEKKRNELYKIIPSVALGFVSVEVPAQVIDEINILQASLQGMRVAVNGLLESIANLIKDTDLTQNALKNMTISLLFDGNKLPPLDYQLYQTWGYQLDILSDKLNDTLSYKLGDKFRVSAEVKGDARFASIASASIIAKVERDKQMYEMAKKYPQYAIENHKGYPTKAHFQALETFGVLPEHRRSFAPVRKIVEKNC